MHRTRVTSVGAPPNVRVVCEFNAWELIAASDIAAATTSSAGFDALSQNSVLLHLNLGGETDVFGYVPKAGAIEVRRVEDLAPALRSLMNPVTRAAILERQQAYSRRVVACVPSPSRAILDRLFTPRADADRA